MRIIARWKKERNASASGMLLKLYSRSRFILAQSISNRLRGTVNRPLIEACKKVEKPERFRSKHGFRDSFLVDLFKKILEHNMLREEIQSGSLETGV